MNLHQARDLMKYILRTNPQQSIMLWSPPGVGKSSIVQQHGKSEGIPVRELRTSQMDPVDVRGIPRINEKGRTEFYPPDEFPHSEDEPEGILFLDEINAGSRATMAAMMQLVLTRQVGRYKLPPGWKVIAAGNRTTDRAVANAMPSALNNRFAHLHIEPDLDTTIRYGLDNDWPIEILQFLRLRPELLHKMDPTTDKDAYPSPRSWDFLCSLKPMDISDLGLRRQATMSCVGQGAMTEFEGFLQVFNQLPSIQGILLNPITTAIPDEMTAKYAVITALVKRADRDTIDAITQYLGRFEDKEFSVMAMEDILATKPQLNNTRAVVSWVADNANFMTG